MNEQLLNRITVNPEICHGKPIIRGLRYPVENVLELLASGMTHAEIREHYIVIFKDSDFFDRYFSHLEPHKLIF